MLRATDCGTVPARDASAPGAQFDRAYVDEMVKDHREDAAAFKRATGSSDPDVQSFASRTLPTVEDHLSHAEQMASSGSARR